MDMLDRVIEDFFPGRPISPFKRRLVEWAINNKEISSIINQLSESNGLAWVSAAIKELNVEIDIHPNDYHHIPAIGTTIVIANHPTVIDGIAVINTVAKVRKDIKILANHMLQVAFPQVGNITIGIRNMHGEFSIKQFREISQHLKSGGVLIIFPAGKIASLTFTGLCESSWNYGFLQLAQRFNAQLVPIHISGKNSFIYYLAAAIWRPLSNLMLTRECLKHRGGTLRIKIGEQLNLAAIDTLSNNVKEIADNIKNHLMQLKKSVPALLPITPNVADEENKMRLEKLIKQCRILKTLSDGKILILYQRSDSADSSVLNELGRLREICYRSIGAGTGTHRDNDIYDDNYYHIILWDTRELEIIGAYRLTPAREQIEKFGLNGLYSHSLFNYDPNFIPKLNQSIEIGRGFIQCKHQKTNALNMLWQGIFFFLHELPQYKYVLGVLSIPQSYPAEAQNLIMAFYQTWSKDGDSFCQPKNRHHISNPTALSFFSGEDVVADWNILNAKLNESGHPLPWPYKQVTKWFQPGGSRIICFIKDDHFHSIAALNFSDMDKLKRMYFMHFNASVKSEEAALN